jgi:hypothetical protein
MDKKLPSMTAENLFVDDGGDGQAIEAIRKSLPQFYVIAAFTLVIEAYNEKKGSVCV